MTQGKHHSPPPDASTSGIVMRPYDPGVRCVSPPEMMHSTTRVEAPEREYLSRPHPCRAVYRSDIAFSRNTRLSLGLIMHTEEAPLLLHSCLSCCFCLAPP